MKINEALVPIFEKHKQERKNITILMIVWVVSRILMEILEIATVAKYSLDMSSVRINVGVLVVCVIFAKYVRDGNKAGAILPLAGGLITVVTALNNLTEIDSLSDLETLQQVYIISFIIIGLIQTAIMLIIILNPHNKGYFNEIKEAQKNLRGTKIK